MTLQEQLNSLPYPYSFVARKTQKHVGRIYKEYVSNPEPELSKKNPSNSVWEASPNMKFLQIEGSFKELVNYCVNRKILS